MASRVLLHVPLTLTVIRAVLGPVVLCLAMFLPSPMLFAACLVIALLSDYFDGVIARRLGVATPGLRRLDSAADSVFYGAALIAAWLLHANLLLPYLAPMAVLVVIEVVRYAYDFRKFGKEASYHMWSSKLWGLALFYGFFSVLVFKTPGWPVAAAIYLGIAADIEGLAISYTLSEWRNDVPTIFHAIQLSRADA